jgi:hypothetical protein
MNGNVQLKRRRIFYRNGDKSEEKQGRGQLESENGSVKL